VEDSNQKMADGIKHLKVTMQLVDGIKHRKMPDTNCNLRVAAYIVCCYLRFSKQ
jgi:hypothetical protein